MTLGAPSSSVRSRAGITLTEILIAIFIMGIGLISLATLFPIGLLRLREAQRSTRSAYLVESAAADVAARGLFNKNSFIYADLLNLRYNLTAWFPNAANMHNGYNPLIQDSGFYGQFVPFDINNPGVNQGITAPEGQGLPFAYDPLWRYQTGLYPDPVNNTTPEARFASGIQSMRQEGDNYPASAHGLQRLTNFNGRLVNINNRFVPVMPTADIVRGLFVSPEDIVWQEAENPNYNVAFTTTPVGTPSTVVPDLSMTFDQGGNPTYQPSNDWRYSWMITARQSNSASASTFDGNIVIMENRPFAVDATGVAGETVVEGVFGFSATVVPAGGPGYGAGADRSVLLRWADTQADPVVKVGDWIADVTYERSQQLVYSRFSTAAPPVLVGVPNPLNNFEWDNLPAQRCFWYQVQKVTPAVVDPQIAGHRSMIVYVNRKLEARTLLDGNGRPVVQNAALVSPHVVNVVPQTFFVR
ncbi:MAG: hypothetical protein U0790_09080 [Isosphaeraceae bacterium]